MPTIRATVSTDRAQRYLAQLCSHTGHMESRSGFPHGRLNHATPTAEAVTDTAGRLRLGTATCDLTVGAAALVLVATAPDPQQLSLLQTAVTRTLERIGRRDSLTVEWEDAAG